VIKMDIMSEAADTEQEFYEQAKLMLQDLGVRNPTIGESGTIPIRGSGEFQIEEMEITETTRTGQKIVNQFPRPSNERIVNAGYDYPICYIFGCSVTEALGIECSKTETQWIDPEIDIIDVPNEVTTATAYLNPLNARIEGDINVEAQNNSEPGKKKTKKTFKCKNVSGEAEEVIEDSAIVSMLADHRVFDEEVDEVVDDIQSAVDDVRPNITTDSQASFEKRGALETIEGIYEVWTRGFTRANVTGSVDVEYEWRNSVKTRTFNIDTTMRLPIQNLNYDW